MPQPVLKQVGEIFKMDTIFFSGFIKNVSYHAQLAPPINKLSAYNLFSFDINEAGTVGLVEQNGHRVAYSKWVSPKRTRSYPFARIYNTYNAEKIITVIPVIKDEGADGDLDRIQFSTLSWMNLLNIYIVLAYYKSADKNQSPKQIHREKLTHQQFDVDLVNEQIQAIINYKQSALHWNRDLFEKRFTAIFEMGIKAYQTISQLTNVTVHPAEKLYQYLEKIQADYRKFRDISLRQSQYAAHRETQTNHALEFLSDGAKAQFTLKNDLGGLYYLTADEVIFYDGKYTIQESKNSTKQPLPGIDDIKDGLFKLILFSNMDTLQLNNVSVLFHTKLKLTGIDVIGSILLPTTESILNNFLSINQGIFTDTQNRIIQVLNIEAQTNHLQIEISGNTGN